MNADNHIWSEKYRPDTLDEVKGQESNVSRLKDWVDDDSIPHLLLHGPAGTGKTASSVAFAKERYGDDWRHNFIDLNASDERGIDMVRDQIKSFAQQAPSGDYQYKIIYLDECDSMTKDAMNALRRIMEKYSDRTRFFLSCNWVSEIIDPIQSRCVPLSYDSLPDDEVEELLTEILENEGLEWEQEALDKIVGYVEGDARRAVQTLQTSVKGGVLTADVVDLVVDQVDEDIVEDMLIKAANGQVEEAIRINTTQVLPEVVDQSGFAHIMMDVLLDCEEIEKDVRFYAISRIGAIEDNALAGRSPYVQWNSFLAQVLAGNYASAPNYE